MIQKTILIILTIFVLHSCNFKSSNTWKNENIDKDKREQIKILNDKLLKAFSENDIPGLRALLSDKLLEKGIPELEAFIPKVKEVYQFDGYKILDEYNVKNPTKDIVNVIPSGFSGDNDYVLNYFALNEEMFVSLLIPDKAQHEILITAIYGNYNNQWKINILHIDQYSVFEKNAPDYYKLAKASYDKSNLIDAVNYISISKKILNPGGDFFRYHKEKDITKFHEKVMKEAHSKYKFPFTLYNIDSNPSIFRIFPEITDEGLFPMVYYSTNINLNDTVALKIENEKIKKEVCRVFNGIDKGKNYIFYWAFHGIPDGTKQVKHFGFVQKLNE